MEYEVISGRRGLPTIRTDGSPSRFLHSLYDPVTEAEQLVDAWDIDVGGRHLMIVGLGLGYHVSACLHRFPELSTVRVVESTPQIVALARRYAPDLFAHPRISIECPLDETELNHLLAQMDIQTIVFHPPSLSLLPFPRTRWLLEEMQMLRLSSRASASRLMENWRHNEPYVSDGTVLTNSRGRHRAQMGMILAAGPSLDTAIPYVHKLAEAGTILIAVSTVLQKLLNSGIHPHYVVLTDSSERALMYLEQLPDDAPLPELIALPTVKSAVISRYPGKLRWALQNGIADIERFAERRQYDVFGTGGSVATLALSLASYFGCDPIIFAGQDLAYVDGRTHAAGTHSGLTANPSIEQDSVLTESVYGTSIRTTISWNSFRHWIESFIRNHPGTTYINASEGAHIEGTNYVDIRAITAPVSGHLN